MVRGNSRTEDPGGLSFWLVMRGLDPDPCPRRALRTSPEDEGCCPLPVPQFPYLGNGDKRPHLALGGNHSPGLQRDVGVMSATSLPPSRVPGQRLDGVVAGPDRFGRRSPGAVGVKFSSACPQLSAWPLRAL